MKKDEAAFEYWFKQQDSVDRDSAFAAWKAAVKYERRGCIEVCTGVWNALAYGLADKIRLRGHERVA